MKRFFFILLALLSVFTLFSCGGGTGESSGTPAESSNVPEPEPDIRSQNINAFLKEDNDPTMKADNIFYKLSYTLSAKPSETYSDDKYTKLTDGITRALFDGYSFVGWETTPVSIDFDLGAEAHRLDVVTVSCLRQIAYGIGLPNYVSVQASEDGDKYVELSRLNIPAGIADSDKYVYTFAFPKSVTARYIRVYCSAPDSHFTFIDEICGYEYREDGKYDLSAGAEEYDPAIIDDIYGCTLDTGSDRVKYTDSDVDFNEKQDLLRLAATEISIFHFDPLSSNDGGGDNTRIENIGILTDGKNDDYFRFYRGGGRHIIADMGTLVSISGVYASFYDNRSSGVSMPPAVNISLSENGSDWITVHTEYNANYGVPGTIYELAADFGREYKARYLRMSFQTVPLNDVSCMVWMSEMSVTGRKNTENAVKPESPDSPYGNYPAADVVGCENILFTAAVNKYGVHNDPLYTPTVESLLPYLGYYDADNKLVDYFFDSVVLCGSDLPGTQPDIAECTKFYLDEIFGEDVQIDALNKAMGEVNKVLGENRKAKLWVSVNIPHENAYLNGETLSGSKGIEKAVKYQVDEFLKRFDSAKYENIEFIGFYWEWETMRDDDDFAAMKAFNSYVHAKGFKTFWCPYYLSNGYWKWQEAGFDMTCLQPNYMFYAVEKTRVATTAELARIYGLSVEIEIEDPKGSGSISLYRKYLGEGVSYGYMNSVKVYYQGAIPAGAYYSAYQDGGVNARFVYDNTYKYAKGKLDAGFDKTAVTDLSLFESTTVSSTSGKRVTAQLPSLEGVTYRIRRSPVYGDVQIAANGKVSYNSGSRFVGTDTLELEIFDGASERKIITVDFEITARQ